MAKKKKSTKVGTVAETKRLIAQSENLRKLTSAENLRDLSPKKHRKLLTQLEKVDRSIAKITKIVS